MNDLEVQYRGELVGRAVAQRDRDEFAFEYATDWLTRDDAFPISANLPLQEQRWEASRAHAFFANLLPEGGAREAVCDRLGFSKDNDVALLTALGGETAGALQFSPVQSDGLAPRDGRDITHAELEEWPAGAPAIPRDARRAPRLSLAGAQHKVTVRLSESGYALPSSDDASTHILKFVSADFPHLTANEYLTTEFASELGLPVVQVYLDDRTEPPILVVERYDRQRSGDSVSRLHQEDLCQALGYLPSRKYESEGGPGVSDLAELIRRMSSRPAADVLALVRWTLFCAISGNADGHAKNLSILYTRSGAELAPHYDLVCTRAYPNLHPYLAFGIGGERDPDRILMGNWEKFARDVGVRARLVTRELERLLADAEPAFERACERLGEQVGDSHAVQHVGPVVKKRVRAIRTHL